MTTAFDSTAAIPDGFWRWPHFSPSEIQDRLDGSLLVVPEFLDMLEALRHQCGFPIPISSAYRTPAHNAIVSATKSEEGSHTLGLAVDVAIVPGDPRCYSLVQAALIVGFTGIEITKDHIHLDAAPSRPDAPRPLLWQG